MQKCVAGSIAAVEVHLSALALSPQLCSDLRKLINENETHPVRYEDLVILLNNLML
jgi:hypothetical protein